MLDRGRRLLGLAFALTSLPVAAGCPQEDQPTPKLMAVATQQDARQIVDHFFDAYLHLDLDSVERMLCEQDDESLDRVRSFITHSQAEGSPYRVDRYQVRTAIPMWIGKEPYFRVEVSFPRKSGRGEILHPYRVRVRDGCIEGFLEPGPGPRPALPPVGSGVGGDEEGLGGSRPQPTEAPDDPPAETAEDPDAIISL